MDGLRQGFSLLETPSSNFIPVECDNYKSTISAPNKAQIESQLISEINQGHYVKTKTKPKIVSALGAIPKQNSQDLRIIHDCSRPIGHSVNSFAQVHKCTFQNIDAATAKLMPGSWMAKIDLKSAYRHVGVHPSNYPYLGLKYHFTGDLEPTYFYDTRLCFGASASVGIFHRLTQSVVRMLQRQGIFSVVCYLDDFLIIANSKNQCQNHMDALLGLLKNLGFTINWKKVVPPTQCITFLGISINSLDMSLSIPSDKLLDIKNTAIAWQHKTKATKRDLQSLIGKLAWTAKCIKAIRPTIRSLIDLQAKLKRPSHRTRLTKQVKSDLQYFCDWCIHFNGVVLLPVAQEPQPDTTLFTDASLEAAAAYHDKDFLYSAWAADLPLISNSHIYLKEMCAILLAFYRWVHKWRNKCIYVFTDNKATQWSLQKGSSKNPTANNLIREIMWLAATYNVTVCVHFVSSSDNFIADAISRFHDLNFFKKAVKYLADEGLNMNSVCHSLHKHMSVNSAYYLYDSFVHFRNSTSRTSPGSGGPTLSWPGLLG